MGWSLVSSLYVGQTNIKFDFIVVLQKLERMRLCWSVAVEQLFLLCFLENCLVLCCGLYIWLIVHSILMQSSCNPRKVLEFKSWNSEALKALESRLEKNLGFLGKVFSFLGWLNLRGGADLRIRFSSSVIGQSWFDLDPQIHSTRELASCLIYAKPLRQPFCWNPAPISVLVWVRSFIEPDVLKTMYRSTIPLRFIWSTCTGY